MGEASFQVYMHSMWAQMESQAHKVQKGIRISSTVPKVSFNPMVGVSD